MCTPLLYCPLGPPVCAKASHLISWTLIPSPLARSCLLPNQTYKVIYIFCLKCFIAFSLYTGQSFWRDLQSPWWSLSYCSCLHASPCWRSSTCASCSLCICSSLFSAAVINTQEKKQCGGEGLLHLADYSPSWREFRQEMKWRIGRNVAYRHSPELTFCLSFPVQTHLPRDGAAYSGLCSPVSVIKG